MATKQIATETKFEGFTPGPWDAHDDDGTGTLPCVLSPSVNAGGNFYVAQCNSYADAALIAAAPDLLRQRDALLAALKEMQRRSFVVTGCFNGCASSVGGECNCTAGKVRAAIALCESESNL